MTKQENIRELLKELRFKIKHHDKYVDVELEFALTDNDLDRIFKVMAKEGAVVKIDRELPEEGLYLPGDFRHPNWLTKAEVKSIMDLAVEPLIK